MSYSYFDHEADLGVVGEGRTLEEAFQEGAQAMLDAICEHEGCRGQEFAVYLRATDLEDLWIFFLNELLGQMDIQEIFLSSCEVKKIGRLDGEYFLEGMAHGFARSRDIIRKSEVKAATYCQVEVVEKPGACRVKCVIDL